MAKNLEKRVYRDERSGQKRRWMTYKMARKWLDVRSGKTDIGIYVVIFFSIVIGFSFFALANLNHQMDSQTMVADIDGDKQFDNPEVMNDGRFSFTLHQYGLPSLRQNESRDADPTVDGIEEEMEAEEWYRYYPEISTLDFIVFGVVALLLPYGIWGWRQDQIRARVEDKFPDFLRDLAEYWKGGLSMTVAIQTLARGEYGNLNDEVHKMATQISWGISFGEVLEMFTERVKSPIVTRAVTMVDEANRAGGRISDILLAAAYDAREIKALEGERQQEVTNYTMVIYLSFLIYLMIILVLANTFVPAIVDSSVATGGGGMSIGNLQVRELNQVWISTVFFYSVIIQSFGNGLAAGFMSTGRFYSAATRASVMMLIGWAVFEIFGIATSMISPGVV